MISDKFNIAKCDKSGRIIEIYKNAFQAAKFNGLPNTSIYTCLAGKRQTAGGFRWIVVPQSAERRQLEREERKRNMYGGVGEIKEIIEKILSKKQIGRIPCGNDKEATFIKKVLDKKGIDNYIFVNMHKELFVKFDLQA